MNNNKNYQIRIEQDKLIFTTAFFRAEKQSMLYKGVYTREFSSMLFASMAGVLAYMAGGELGIETAFTRVTAVIFVFAAAFLGSRKFLFCERYLRAVFSKPDNTVSISRPAFIGRRTERIPLDSISSVTAGSKKFTPENMDGIRFVEKISAQHGSFVPGLGDEEEYVTLSLNLSDGSTRTIYAVRTDDEPDIPLKQIQGFIEKE